MRAAALALCLLLANGMATGMARASPADQELAGASRTSLGGQATLGPAMAEGRPQPVPVILFEPRSARLTPHATRLLDSFGRMLAEDRVRLESHAGRNRDLAARRAGAVLAYLEQNCGVAAARVQVITADRPDDGRVWVRDLGE